MRELLHAMLSMSLTLGVRSSAETSSAGGILAKAKENEIALIRQQVSGTLAIM